MFTKITEEELGKFNKKYNELNRIHNNKTLVGIHDLKRNKIALLGESQESDIVKRKVQVKLSRLAIWENEGIPLGNWNLLKLNYRFHLHKFMTHKLSYSVEAPKPFQVALFTMTGKKTSIAFRAIYREKSHVFWCSIIHAYEK